MARRRVARALSGAWRVLGRRLSRVARPCVALALAWRVRLGASAGFRALAWLARSASACGSRSTHTHLPLSILRRRRLACGLEFVCFCLVARVRLLCAMLAFALVLFSFTRAREGWLAGRRPRAYVFADTYRDSRFLLRLTTFSQKPALLPLTLHLYRCIV